MLLTIGSVLAISFIYLGILFALAYYGDKRADAKRSLISTPHIYALSLAVYCTAWTFYGSVGRAARSGADFLPIYLGPTLMATLGWLIWRKIVRISKIHRITSIADFIASRYGKSATLGGVVAVIAFLAVVPYIALQLKAISTSFYLITRFPDIADTTSLTGYPLFQNSAFYIAMLLAVFAILFGTRHLDVTERHEGLVAAIALESIVKLVAFLAVGLFVTYGIYNGFGDLFQKAQAVESIQKTFILDANKQSFNNWALYTLLSMLAILTLPRQFQVTVVENVNENHLSQAIWLFPLYLLAINIFVLPVALGGLLHFGGQNVDADWFVLTLPMAYQQKALALFVFIGGMSAATGMVIVETIALSTMICNELAMPILLRMQSLQLTQRKDLSFLILTIRRVSIVLILLLGYTYFHLIGGFFALVSLGLVSFTGVAQFAPALLGGIFWKGGTRIGAICGLVAGFIVWAYTLVMPTMVEAGLLAPEFIAKGPWGIRLLKPFALMGLEEFDRIGHAVFWSLLANVTAFVTVSLLTRPSALEHTQAALFVDVFRYSGKYSTSSLPRGTASVPDLRALLQRFLGSRRADEALQQYALKHNIDYDEALTADAGLVNYTERLLGGAIGSASAHVILNSVIKEEPLEFEQLMGILDETRQVIAYSRELEKATAQLKAANESLEELDRMKDEFISTVTHELRTPLTSIRSLAEILHDNPDLEPAKQAAFSSIIIEESKRLTRLISQVLDIQKGESGRLQMQLEPTNLREVVAAAVQATSQLVREKSIRLESIIPDYVPHVYADKDRLIQVMVNLISNAVKFSNKEDSIIRIMLLVNVGEIEISIKDNGIGIKPKDRAAIFEKFRQLHQDKHARPSGSGLGLSITKSIVEFHKGRIWVNSKAGKGSTFYFTLPIPQSAVMDVVPTL